MNAHALIDAKALPLALAVTFAMNFVLLGVIALVKLRRERREAFAARLRDSLTEQLIETLEGERIDVALPKPSIFAGSVALETIVSLIAVLKGRARENLTALLERSGYVDYLLRGLRSRNELARSRSASLLGGTHSKHAVDGLVGSLKDDPSPEVRLVSAEALGLIGDAPSVDLLLAAARDPSRYQEVRLAAVLASMGAVAVPPIERALSEDDTRLTTLLLDILADVGMVTAPDRVVAMLRHRSPEVRSRAATLLGTAGVLESVPALIFATNDPLWFVRLRTVKALMALGLPEDETLAARYLDALTHLLYDETWFVRRNAAAALAASGDRGERILRSIDSGVARSALELNVVRRGRGAATL
ncbi:MAG TPA: HEAT repeat domain-containing protein [Candidatus Baltobacteraceae bacterium]|nr:HEAT repeat domain-containing protein [Candidatus Baltobacteraceae bacterium]